MGVTRIWLTPKAVARGSFLLEPLGADGYAATGNACDLDRVLQYARRRGGCGRISRSGRVVGYWGGIPQQQDDQSPSECLRIASIT